MDVLYCHCTGSVKPYPKYNKKCSIVKVEYLSKPRG